MKTLTIEPAALQRRIKVMILIFIAGLVLSGLTAFPLEWELNILKDISLSSLSADNGLRQWILKVHQGLQDTNLKYPFLAYGTDWLAFAHLVIALVFLGPLKDPVKNIWVIEFGMIACVLIIPLALVAGAVRGIPVYWQLIDCSFGLFGILPLAYTHQLIKRLEKAEGRNF